MADKNITVTARGAIENNTVTTSGSVAANVVFVLWDDASNVSEIFAALENAKNTIMQDFDAGAIG